MDETSQNNRRLLPLLIAVLAVLGIVLVVAGRLLDAGKFTGWQDPLYSVLLAFTVDGTFLGPQNFVTMLGAFAAALATYLALGAAGYVLFRTRLWRWRARRARRHIVIVGDDSDDAEALAHYLATHHIVVLVSPTVPARRDDFIWIEPVDTANELFDAAHLEAAMAVVVIDADEKRNAALATSIAQIRPPGSQLAIWCRLGDRLLAERVASPAFGEPRVLVFDDASATARQAFGLHPAHAAAERLAAPGLHIAVFGFGRLGQAMAEEALLSGIATGLATPRVTVLDIDAEGAERAYRATRPALDLAGDFAFIQADLAAAATSPALAQAAFEALAGRDDASRITAIAICLPRDEDNVRLALALLSLAHSDGRYRVPLFMRVRDRDACALVRGEIVPLERPTRLLATDVVDLAHRDRAAQLLHEAGYRKWGGSPGASADWNRLPETYRRANRRGADHIAAKLWSLGLTSERDPHSPITVEKSTFAALIAPLAEGRQAATLEPLAVLEHRRWIAERALEGWAPGAPRDDDRKIHPMLQIIEHADLPPAEAQKDRDQVLTLLSSIVPSDQRGAARPEIRVALAGHRNLPEAELARATAALVETLLPRLKGAEAVTLISPLAPGADIAATEALATALAGRAGLRLIVPEAVPYRIVLEVAGRDGGDPDFIQAMMARRAALLRRFEHAETVAIGRAGQSDDSYRRNPQVFETGLSTVNAYLARRADIVAVLWDGAPARGAGGTGELVAFCRDPASIPPALDRGPSPRSKGPAELVVIGATRG